jgi:catechol 2,3-dioxygenase-like lactoylglutathione lyase family enzyme
MRPRLSVITLAVTDLERALRFYRDGLGWETQGVVGTEFEHGAVAFLELEGGLALALWPRASLAHDTGLAEADPSASPAFTLGHNVVTQGEVDVTVERMRRAGAALVVAPRTTDWGGYAGSVRDPDGHVWEIVWNPARLPPD